MTTRRFSSRFPEGQMSEEEMAEALGSFDCPVAPLEPETEHSLFYESDAEYLASIVRHDPFRDAALGCYRQSSGRKDEELNV